MELLHWNSWPLDSSEGFELPSIPPVPSCTDWRNCSKSGRFAMASIVARNREQGKVGVVGGGGRLFQRGSGHPA